MKWINFSLALMMISTASFAAGSKHKKHEWFEKLNKELNLSEEQVAKVKEIRKESKATLSESRKKSKEAKKAFKEAMSNPKTSNDELKEKFNGFLTTRNEFQIKRFEMMLEMRKVLSPEQIKKFQEMKKKFKGKRKEQKS